VATFLLRRLLIAIPTLLIIATLAFVLLRVTPGGPFDGDKPMIPEIRRSIEARYHLDEPLWQQYLRYLGDLARGDLGAYHLAHAARADLCRRLGRTAEARASYERARGLTRQEPERRFLERRLRELPD